MFDTRQSVQNRNVIKYDYLENTLYPSYKKTPTVDKYIEMSYLGNPSYPNLTLGTTLYNTTKIYIYGGKTHPIKDLDYDGELVIEQTAITNWSGKVYTCIPLKTTNGIADTVIDQIISMTTQSIPLSINKILQQTANTKAVIYNDTGFFTSSNTIIVFLNPIHIRHSLKDFQKSSEMLFAGYNPQYSIVNVTNMQMDKNNQSGGLIETFKEGAEGCPAMPTSIPDSDVYISCRPAEVSSEDVQSFNMPLTSDMIEENKNTKMMKNTLSLFTIIFIIGFISYVVPFIYDMLIMSEILDAYKGLDPEEKKEKVYARVSMMDVVISLIILTFSFGLIGDGANSKRFAEKSTGMLIGAIYVMGLFMISSQRTDIYFTSLLNRIGLKGVDSSDPNNQFDITKMDFFKFLGDIKDLLLQNIQSSAAIFLFLLVVVFPGLYLSVEPRSVSGFVLAYGLVFSIYVIYIIDKNVNKNAGNKSDNDDNDL